MLQKGTDVNLASHSPSPVCGPGPTSMAPDTWWEFSTNPVNDGLVTSFTRTSFPHRYDGRILTSWQGRCERTRVLNRGIAQLDVSPRKMTLATLWSLDLSGVRGDREKQGGLEGVLCLEEWEEKRE